MPYKLGKQGEKYCVLNSETGENKGCSDTRPMAIAHMRKLYSVEKEASEVEALVTKAIADFVLETGEAITDEEMESKEYYETPAYSYGAKSYRELDALKDAREKEYKAQDLIFKFPELARAIMFDNTADSSGKAAAIEGLAKELAERLRNLDGEDSEEKAISQREDVSDSDKEYADEKNKKYPVDTEDHIRAAWSYINQEKNAAKYSGGEVTQIKSNIIAAWKSKIDKKGPPSAKELRGIVDGAIFALKGLVNSLPGEFEEGENETAMFVEDTVVDEKDQSPAFMSIKSKDGDWLWLARYSNKYRDNDYPPEIISDASHRRFEKQVDAGLFPLPELWLWHEKNIRLGQAEWVAYDADTGFALAAGRYYPGCEEIAEWLSKQSNVAVSHGMPTTTIVRDKKDKSIILEHQTVEISPLPGWAAANKLTGFSSIHSKESDEMSITADKRKKLEEWGIPADLLSKVETLNQGDATKAAELGIESKEATPETAEPVAQEAAPVATQDKSGEPSQDTPSTEPPVTRKEIAEGVTAILQPIIEQNIALAASVEALKKELSELKGTTETVKSSTPATLFAMLTDNFGFTSKSAEVAPGDPLESAKPKETAAPVETRTGIPFIDQMIAPK